MKHADFERMAGLMMSRVAVPSAPRASAIDRHTLVVGFDTEWRPGTRDLLSVQLAMMVGGEMISTVYEPAGTKITKADLVEMLRSFMASHATSLVPWRGSRRVAFVGHNIAADLGIFADPLSDFAISPMGRGHVAIGDLVHPLDGPWKVWILDLFAFFSTRLETIGAAIGLPKIKIDVNNIHIIKIEDPALFAEYGRRDAEIALKGFLYLRELLMGRWGIDPLNHGTPAAIGGEIFRRHFFRTAAAAYKTAHEEVSRKKKDGTWSPTRRTIHSYDGDLVVRDLAIRTLHGGRNESFIRGLYPNRVVERDVRSMYPHAAKAIGLPNYRTRWETVTSPDGFQRREGFALIRFAFAPGTERPCLPVRLGGDKLFFPLTGESHCTFAEVRLAQALGAAIEIIKARGFVPGPRELEHELGRYLTALLVEKNAAQKGTLDYQFYKDLLNQPLGKLGQKSTGSTALAIERLAREHGTPGVSALLAKRPGLTADLRGDPDLGSLWSPEQLGLILGKARALIGQILVVSRALSVSTDAVIIAADASVQCDALDELRSVGSDMPVEVEGDALFIGRSRQYALLVHADGVPENGKVLARDSHYAVVKIARHGSPETVEQFSTTILACIAAGTNVAPTRLVTRELKPEAAVRAGVPIGTPTTIERATRFDWDGKRVLVDRDVNPFRSYTTTRPYQTKNRRDGAAHVARVRSGEARRRTRPVSETKRLNVLSLLGEGRSLREVARLTGVPPSTVASIRDRAGTGAAPAGGGGDAT